MVQLLQLLLALVAQQGVPRENLFRTVALILLHILDIFGKVDFFLVDTAQAGGADDGRVEVFVVGSEESVGYAYIVSMEVYRRTGTPTQSRDVAVEAIMRILVLEARGMAMPMVLHECL